jgi:sugar phosphate isomerase/epimerase
VRREAESDARDTLAHVRSLGFDGVELAGTYGWSAAQWQDVLSTEQLSVVGAHVSLEVLEKNLATEMEWHRAIGNTRLILPSIPPEYHHPAGFRAIARRLNAIGTQAQSAGFSFYYHHHDFEIKPLSTGESGLAILRQETDPALVQFEIDTYWLERGGEEAGAYVSQHADRIGLIHAKEIRRRDQADVPAGEGDVDFKTILTLAKQHQWPVIVEFEGTDAFTSTRASAQYLRSLQTKS